MSVAARRDSDPFRQMLVWSIVLHGLAFTAVTLAAGLRTSKQNLPAPVGMFVNLGQSGPAVGSGGGGAPQPKPEPKPVEPPKEKEPTVVRPTKEDRDELPMPDAPVRKKPEEKKPDSGLRGADAASKPSAALDTAAGPPGLGLGGAGGGSPFDQDFEYAYYVQQMLAKISQHWQRTAVRGTAVAVIRFTILRDGRIQGAEIETSSGLTILDRSALRAVVLSDPLPPLPNSYPRDQVGVHLRFTYSDKL